MCVLVITYNRDRFLYLNGKQNVYLLCYYNNFKATQQETTIIGILRSKFKASVFVVFVTRYWEMQANYVFQLYRSLILILKDFVLNNRRMCNRKVSICGLQMVLRKLVT